MIFNLYKYLKILKNNIQNINLNLLKKILKSFNIFIFI